MKKLVLKTVAITFAALVAACAAIYAFVAFVSPKTLAKFWANAGNYSYSVKYYEKQYEKSETVSDLATLCAKIDVKDDSARAVKYLAIFTDNEEFTAFCDEEDKNGGYTMTSYEYYYGMYSVAEYYESGIIAAVNVAKRAVEKEYSDNNAFYIIMSEVKGLTENDGKTIAETISEIKDNITDTAQRAYAERDENYAKSIK